MTLPRRDRRPRRGPTLRWRVVLALALAAVVPTVIVGVLAIVRARASVEREVERGALAHIRALGAALDGTLQDARRTVELAAATWADAPEDARGTQLLVERLRRDLPIVHQVSIVDPDARLVAGDPLPPFVDIGSHSFGGYVGDAILVGDRPVVRLVVQARARTGELIGVVVASLDLAFVHDLISTARLGPGARVIVVDGAGLPVASSDDAISARTLAGKDPAVDRALSSSVEGTLVARGWVSAYRNLSGFQSLRGVRWAILHEQPEREAYAMAYQTTRTTILVGVLALAIALALGAWFATRLTRPLADLAARADAIALGGDRGDGPVRGPGEIGVLGQRIDDMARRIAERAELQDALARGERLASVGVMAAQVAHEVNNPLTTVLGYAKLLLENRPADDPARPGLELIADEAERMKTIVGSLLEYARAPRASEKLLASIEGCDPVVVVERLALLLLPQLRKARAQLVVETSAATRRVLIEANALQQVLVNLVQNAAQAMGDGGGRIALTATAVAPRAPGGTGTTLFAVTDEGPGVPEADRARVFDPFFTTKAPGVGTGLGLAVCKYLVTSMGGTIEVGAAAGERGAEFRVIIPNAPA